MPSLRPLPALALVLTAAATPAVATARPEKEPPRKQPLVVRGDATVVDGPCDAAGCRLEITGGRSRGAPVGTGPYSGALIVRVAEAFPNGEDGICAPLVGRIVLGAGTADRLVLGVSGHSCQDGSGPLETSSFTGLARFTVKYGTGRHARAAGSGLALLSEDAANHQRMTLTGRSTR